MRVRGEVEVVWWGVQVENVTPVVFRVVAGVRYKVILAAGLGKGRFEPTHFMIKVFA